VAALVSGCGSDPLEANRALSGNIFSGNHLKPKDYPIHGIGISKFQGDIDWNAVADSGVMVLAVDGGGEAAEKRG
jgi:lysozyme